MESGARRSLTSLRPAASPSCAAMPSLVPLRSHCSHGAGFFFSRERR